MKFGKKNHGLLLKGCLCLISKKKKKREGKGFERNEKGPGDNNRNGVVIYFIPRQVSCFIVVFI